MQKLVVSSCILLLVTFGWGDDSEILRDNVGKQLIAARYITKKLWDFFAHPGGPSNVINELADSPDVVRVRLVNGKITFVHRRVWPALVRISDHLAPERLASIDEEHTSTGAHRKIETTFPDWVPDAVLRAAEALTERPRALASAATTNSCG